VKKSGATAGFQAAAGAGVIVALMLPFSRGRLEATLVGHVLVQMPLLVLAGWLLGSALAEKLERVMEQWNRFGVAGFTFAIFVMLFWMVPRSVDTAIAHTGYEIFKFAGLPCAGAALALSFPRTIPLLAGALKAHFVSMLAVLAWLYTAAPVRLCNSYLASDQKMLGAGTALFACAFAIYWALGPLFGLPKPQPTIASGAAAAREAPGGARI
jgi:hypothetical protein